MADIYVDAGLATGLDDGTSWTDAYQTFETYRVAGLSANDHTYVMGGTTDVIATSGLTTISYSSSPDTPVAIIGVQPGTTNEPPQLSDLITDRSDANIPTIEVTGSTGDLEMVGFIHSRGIHYKSARVFRMQETTLGSRLSYEECIIQDSNQTAVGSMHMGSGGNQQSTVVEWYNVEWKSGAPTITNQHAAIASCSWTWDGGVYTSGHATTGDAILIEVAAGGGVALVNWQSVDLSALLATTLFDSADATFGIKAKLERCKIPSGFIGSSTTFTGDVAEIEFVACNSSTDHTAAIPDYMKQTARGIVDHETTVVRTGGGSDGDNSLAYKLTPRAAASTKKGILPLYTPWMSIWVKDTDTAVTIFSLLQLASATRDQSEIFAEIGKPNEGVGTAGSDSQYETTRELPLGGTLTSVTTDSSTWGGGGSQSKFKHEFTISPEYAGPLRVRLGYSPESTDSLFVDSMPEVT